MSARGSSAPVTATLVLAAVLAAGIALSPWVGGDLVAQQAHADFFAAYGWTPLNLSWYGGTAPVGYSLLSPPLLALLGPAWVGASATVVAAGAWVLLLRRTGARRPLVGGLLGALSLAANQLSGRTTFGLGVAFALLALLALTAPPGRRWRRPAAALGGLLASGASPVAGVLLGLGALALVIDGTWSRERRIRAVDGCWLAVGVAAPLALVATLGVPSGLMSFSGQSALRTVASTAIVLLLVPRRWRLVQITAVLSLVLVAVAYLLPDPVGSTSTRLVLLLGVPAAVALSRLPWPVVVAGVVGIVLLLPPLVVGDLVPVGVPSATSGYFQPLLDQLAKLEPIGRIEVVPLGTHLESRYVAEQVPLARGWLRQADLSRNALFYDGSLSATSYRDWLVSHGVSYVAVADGRPDWPAYAEQALVLSGLPYLRSLWSDSEWHLYAVTGAPGLVGPAATLVDSTATQVSFHVSRSGPVPVKLVWSRWLTLDGPAGCLRPGPGGWTEVDAAVPGSYVVSSSWTPQGHCD